MTSKRKDKASYDALIRARTRLLIDNPFFGCLALHLELVEVTDEKFCDTMAVDGVHMYYWPKFVLSIDEWELVGVVVHEVFHCAYKHMTRRGDRRPRMFNVAGDYRINWDCKEAGFKLPGDPIPWNPNPKKGHDKGQPKMGHLYDPQFKDMSTEEIYEKLK